MNTKYLGVYINKYKPTHSQYPFRVAIKRYINGVAHFTNIGYFEYEDTAAFIYNVHALLLFKQGAVINDVPISDRMQEEVVQHSKDNPNFCQKILDAEQIVIEHAEELHIYKTE